ncbi:MAG: hypothetical protein KHX13_04880 [Acidaminococcus intestini]|uniref:Uncharacterized protein n=1 Tax=Acidaminococcus intestini TaxID=187327 RepID=A0A943I4K7_9FIRM|nr:hypothetical protein [Acidaminococcus intestini]
MLYSQNVKNMIAGISQQPPLLRLPEQLEEQINGFSSESSGLLKRFPTVYVKTLMEHIDHDKKPLVHFANRDASERYIMYFFGDTIRIFDLEGNEKKVTIKDDPSYLKTSQPRKDLCIITVADYTFIGNKTIKTKLTGKKSPNYFATQGSLVHIKSGQYGRTYKVFVDGKEKASHTTPDGSQSAHTAQIDTNFITGKLAEQLHKNGYTVDQGNSWLRIRNTTNVTTQDGFNNLGLLAVNGSVQKFSLLPVDGPSDYCVKVRNTTSDDATSGAYFCKYNAKTKVWEECPCPNIPIELDPSTMPHTLVRNGDGSFTFQRVVWKERECGDEDSNPEPSFVGKPINDIFFYRNRLGFLSQENVILSESAEYFNFWMATANDILDTDCIDISTTTTRINILNYAVPFNETLYIFSDSTQFRLAADTALSPKNVALVDVTNFDSSPDCRPVVSGKNLYFPVERAEYTSIREYYNVESISDVKNAQDITSHVPSFIPNGVYKVIPQNNENILLFLTEGDQNCLYVYKYLFIDEQRLQASWSKWDMHGRVLGAFFIGSALYIVVNRGGKHILEKMDFTYSTLDFEGHEPYRVYLDTKTYSNKGSYNEKTHKTTFNLLELWSLKDTKDIEAVGLVTPDGGYTEILKEDFEDNMVSILGDYSGQDVVVGIPYEFRATLSPLYMRQASNDGGVKALTNGRLQVRDIRINYADTGGFKVYVKTHGHTYTYTMTSKILGHSVLGEIAFKSGTFRVPVQSLNTSYKLWISSTLPLPLSLIGYLWYGNFIARTRGV